MIPLTLVVRQGWRWQRCLVAAKPLGTFRRLHLSVQERSDSFSRIASTRPDNIEFRIGRGLASPEPPTPTPAATQIPQLGEQDSSSAETLELPFRSFEEVKRLVQVRDWPPVPSLSVENLVVQQQHAPTLLFDVRSPEEFESGHIPGAQNLPLLQNDQRVEVGKAFRHVGPSAALTMALAHVFPKLPDLLSSACSKQQKLQNSNEKVVIYCKRGGLRSQSVAAFLSQHGLEVQLLEGGYKAFRTWATSIFERQQRVCILGGSTGSGKTEVLAELRRHCQVLDLEALAHHKGSVFGHLGEPPQPSSEQFRNDVALLWAALDARRLVFLEDEGSFIGRVCLPPALWKQMRQAEVVVHLDVPFKLRARRSLETYGSFGVEALSKVILNFQKQMGRPKTDELLAKLRAGDLASVCEEVLANYDRSYAHHLTKGRDPARFRTLQVSTSDAAEVAQHVRRALAEYEL